MLGWTKLSFDNKPAAWKGESNKIRVSFPAYLVSVFSDKNTYRMRIVTEQQVSENKKVDLNEITLYDTFLATLYVMSLDESDAFLTDASSLSSTAQFYDLGFFNSLGYRLPTNNVQTFDPTQPVFLFDRGMERQLLKIYGLTQAGEGAKDAIQYLNRLAPDQINSKLRATLLKKLQKLQTAH
jgi:hypothetical protein